MATLLEAEPFVRGLDLLLHEETPFPVYTGKDDVLVICGIGKSNAAMAVACLSCRFSLSRIINAGAAGCTHEKFSLGDIFQVSRAVEYDRPHIVSKKPREMIPDTLDGLPCAVLATQDVPVTLAEKRMELSTMADLVDMEGAAVLQAAKKFGLPAYLFKIVTDTPAHEKDADIIRNIRMTRDRLYEFCRDRVLCSLR